MQYTQQELDNILELHKKWVNGEQDGIRANLQDADLRYADLRYADLRYADLYGADLQNADLQNADLRYADLRYADLRYADLQNADLRYADLQNANLDFSCLPLWCGGARIKADRRFIAQLAWHLASMDTSNCDGTTKEAMEIFRKMPMSQWFAEYRNDLPKLPE